MNQTDIVQRTVTDEEAAEHEARLVEHVKGAQLELRQYRRWRRQMARERQKAEGRA